MRLSTKITALIESILLEEASNLFAAGEEVVIAGVLRFTISGEYGRLLRRRYVLLGQHHGSLTELETVLVGNEIGDH